MLALKTQAFYLCLALQATVAQSVEQRIRNAWVGGSSPPGGSIQELLVFDRSPRVVRSGVFSVILEFKIFGVSLNML